MNINKSKQTLVIFALLVATTNLSVAWAKNEVATGNSKEPVAITLSLKKITIDASGKEKREDALKVKPDDVLEYSAEYRNQSTQAVTGLKAVLPVPKGLVYIKETAKPLGVQATIDGSNYAAEPLLRIEKDSTGKEVQVEVPYLEYRSLRWEVGELGAGKKVVVSARMQANRLPKSPEELVTKSVK